MIEGARGNNLLPTQPVPGRVLDQDGHDVPVGWVSKCRYVSRTTRVTRAVSMFVN